MIKNLSLKIFHFTSIKQKTQTPKYVITKKVPSNESKTPSILHFITEVGELSNRKLIVVIFLKTYIRTKDASTCALLSA